MKKHPFVLIEVLIAIALLALCAFPLISGPLFFQKKMRDKFFELELEREAEKIYYETLKKGFEFNTITREFSKKTELGPLVISIDGLGEKTYHPHYHLYHNAHDDYVGKYYRVFIGICFENCQMKHRHFEYKFSFVGKNVVKKQPDPHGEGRKTYPENEGISRDI